MRINSVFKKIIPEINIVKFLSNMAVNKETMCWEWQGKLTTNGYGRFGTDYDDYSAHRISYAIFKSEPREDMSIDHICSNRKCINPDHLRIS